MGPVESATARFVESLGVLSPRQAALAAGLMRTACLLDVEDVAPTAAVGLARELRTAVGQLEVRPAASTVQAAPETIEARRDAVQAAQDELARRRQAGRPA